MKHTKPMQIRDFNSGLFIHRGLLFIGHFSQLVTMVVSIH